MIVRPPEPNFKKTLVNTRKIFWLEGVSEPPEPPNVILEKSRLWRTFAFF